MARAKKGRNINGVLLLDKITDASSNAVLQRVKRLFNANKAGHTGALDPLATGMLPICLGEATKFSQFLLDSDKRYVVTAKLGERTDTSDSDGTVVETRDIAVNLDAILASLACFRGDIMQVPTMFSALKHNGKPLYEYARAGITIEREARPITIFELKFISYEAPFLTLEVHCSKGTYVRTLVDDLGETLGCGAHVTMLRRLEVAHYPKEKMITLADLEILAEQGFEKIDALLLPMDSPVANLNSITLNNEQSYDISFGRAVKIDQQFANNEFVRIFNQDNLFLGIGTVINNKLQPKKMVNY